MVLGILDNDDPAELVLREQQLLAQSPVEAATRLIANREILEQNAGNLGISSDYLSQLKQIPVEVGFAEQGFPIPTLFPGGMADMQGAFERSRALTAELQAVGIPAIQNSLLTLKWDAMPSNGYAACDYLLLPKNADRNARIFLLGSLSTRRSLSMVPYGLLNFRRSDLDQVKEAIRNACNGMRKTVIGSFGEEPVAINKPTRKATVEMIIADLEAAFAQGDGRYYEFVSAFNRIFTGRFLGTVLTSPSVDDDLSNLLRVGLADPRQFFRLLEAAGFPLAPGNKALKFVNEQGRMQSLDLALISGQVFVDFPDVGLVPFAVAIAQQNLYPSKGLAYFLLMSGLLPQIYLDDNQEIYPPYFETQAQLESLGLKPVIMPYRERLEIPFEEGVTLFDLYGNLLLSQES